MNSRDFDQFGRGPAKKYRKMQQPQQTNGMNGDSNSELITREKAEALGIPKRWLYCPPLGKEINGFLPMKTPLSQLYDACVEPQYRFYPSDVFKYGPNRFDNPTAKIGLWIDLTKTSRYYHKNEVESRGAKYVKMPLAGHGESPSREDVNTFLECVREFRKDNPDDIIAVHCTHGFNRTGFLICAYIYTEIGDALDFAVQSFAAARPDGIYKEDYLRDLSTMFSSDEELRCPGRPDWEDDANPPYNFEVWKSVGARQQQNGHIAQNEQPSTSNGTQPSSKDPSKPQFMDGQVDMVTLIEDKEMISYLRGTIKDYCEFKRDIFPGSQPVSLERSREFDNLKLLKEEDYMVSWKADGMRYLVLIKDEDQIYAFDRDNNVFQLDGISFPHRKHNRHIRDTLVDAEVIIEHIPAQNDEQAKIRPRMLIYDIVRFEDTQAGKCDFRMRFNCIEFELMEPRKKAAIEGKLNPQKEPMGIRRKDFYDLSATEKLLSPRFTSQVCHEIDGLIFQPVSGGYSPGRYDKLLKWKPQDQSTIDFKLHIVIDSGPGKIPERRGDLYVLNLNTPFACMKVKRSDLQYDGKIVECKMENGQWKVMRERTDKSFPNAYTTAVSVYRCILSPITKDVLLNFIREIVASRTRR